MRSKISAIFLSSFLLVNFCFAQLTLEQALANARSESAIGRLNSIVEEESELKIENIEKQWYPKIALSGQATYQSNVTRLDTDNLPFPVDFDFLTRDQYRIAGEIRQTIYDGGATKNVKKLIKTSSQVESLKAELKLEELRHQIIEIYFGILELDAQKDILSLEGANIQANLKRVQAAVDNGISLKSEGYTLEAAQLLIDQKIIEFQGGRVQLVTILSELIKDDLSANIVLQWPDSTTFVETTNTSKTEYKLFDLQRETLIRNFEIDKSASKPKTELFFQGGYGKPGLNLLSNAFDGFYIGGVRAKWELNNLYTQTNDRQLQQLGQEKINIQKDVFDEQANIEISKQKTEIEKIKSLLKKDEEILRLREKIRKVAEVQLENGTITSADFLLKFNEENEVRAKQSIRKIQLRKAEYLLNHIMGNY